MASYQFRCSARSVRPRAAIGLVAIGTLLAACSKDDHAGADAGPARGDGDAGASSGGASSPGSGGAAAVGTGNGGASGHGTSSGGAAASGTGGTTGTTDSGTGTSGGAANGGAASGGANAAGGAHDAGVDKDAASAVDPCATARFCDNFETYPAGKAPAGGWKVSTNLGAVSVVDTAHFSGTKSVQCTTQAGANSKTANIKLDLASVFPVPGNAYYGRMMTRLEAAPDTSVHWTFIQSSGLIPGQNYHSVYRYGGQLPVKNGDMFVGTKLMANYDTPDNYSGTGPASDCYAHSNAVVMPVAKWTCVEWQFDGPNDTLRFWLNGAPIDSLTIQHTGQGCVHQDKTFEWKAPSFENLQLGWESYQMDTERTLYIDDVVISDGPIGCPPQP